MALRLIDAPFPLTATIAFSLISTLKSQGLFMTSQTPESSPDPWFQDRFAARIGGSHYGKGNEIYKFELIKRAKRKAIADHPDRRMLDFGTVSYTHLTLPTKRIV